MHIQLEKHRPGCLMVPTCLAGGSHTPAPSHRDGAHPAAPERSPGWPERCGGRQEQTPSLAVLTAASGTADAGI